MNEYRVIGHRVEPVIEIIRAESEEEALQVFSDLHFGVPVDQIADQGSIDVPLIMHAWGCGELSKEQAKARLIATGFTDELADYWLQPHREPPAGISPDPKRITMIGDKLVKPMPLRDCLTVAYAVQGLSVG